MLVPAQGRAEAGVDGGGQNSIFEKQGRRKVTVNLWPLALPCFSLFDEEILLLCLLVCF